MDLSYAYIYWDVSPIIFRIPETRIALTWYGLAWAAGLIISRQAGLYIFLRDGRYTSNLPGLFLLIVIPAFAGARLGHFLFYDPWHMVHDPWRVILPPYHGLSSHGGVVGILIGVYVWCRKNQADYLFVLDRLAIVACVAGGLIRLGNLMNSEIIGVPTTVPWAFVFARVDMAPRHPAQLYEALFYISLFFTLFYIWYRFSSRLHSGMMLGMALTILWGFRFCIEMIKVNQSPAEDAFLLNNGQLLSLPFMLLGLCLMARKYIRLL